MLQWLVRLCVDSLVELCAGALDGLLLLLLAGAAEDVRVGILDVVGHVVLRGHAGMSAAAAVVVVVLGTCGARRWLLCSKS